MSKVKEKKETGQVVEGVDYVAKWKEERENLVLQIRDHLDKVEYHKTMATKAQGAIEVGDQLHPHEENNVTK